MSDIRVSNTDGEIRTTDYNATISFVELEDMGDCIQIVAWETLDDAHKALKQKGQIGAMDLRKAHRFWNMQVPVLIDHLKRAGKLD